MLIRNLLSMGAMRVFSALLTLWLIVSIGQLWGLVALGQFSLLLAWFMLFQLLPLLGLNMHLVRDVAAHPAHAPRHASTATAFALAVALALCLLIGLGSEVVYNHHPELHLPLWLIGLCLLPTAPILVSESLLLAQQRMPVIAKVNMGETLARTCIALALVHAGAHLTAVFMAFLVCRVGAALVYHRHGGLPPLLKRDRLCPATLRAYLRLVPKFLGIAVFATLLSRLDVLMLSVLTSPLTLGTYAAPARLYELGQMVPQIISITLFARITAAYQNGAARIAPLIMSAVTLPLLLLLPPGILFATHGAWFLSLFGAEAAAGTQALRLLLGALTLVGLNQLLGMCMLAMERQDLDFKSQAIACAFAASLMCWWIPSSGAEGAAAAVLATQAAMTALRWWMVRHMLPWSSLLPALVGLTLASVAMVTTLNLLPPAWSWLPALLVYAAVAYGLIERHGGLVTRSLHAVRA